jgi:lipoprotein-anchoring transpeptidase ErfK/SrfK
VSKSDPIVGRSIWLDGLEPQNKNSMGRLIRMHGTSHTDSLGKPVSMGCVRFNPQDIVLLCNYIQPGDIITITP